MKHQVFVGDVPCDIEVYQKSKTVWIAVGEYGGNEHQAKRASASSAAKAWVKLAEPHRKRCE